MPMAEPYEPINTLKPVTDNVWIIDGPIIGFGYPWPKMPFPTRATLIRLPDGKLFIHSPTPLTATLQNAITEIGQPAWIVGPNRIHYWWLPEWKTAYPDAIVYLAPRIQEQSKGRIDFACQPLTGASGYPWDEAIDTFIVAGRFMTEFDFFHRASRTLIVTDLIENFEAHKVHSWLMRFLCRIGGVLDPHGGMPTDLRRTFPKAELRASIDSMIAANPERIILAHGRWYAQHGKEELQRAFRWLLA